MTCLKPCREQDWIGNKNIKVHKALLDRAMVVNKETILQNVPEDQRFTVMSYNTLAYHWIWEDEDQLTSCYTWCRRRSNLYSDVRHDRMMSEIKHYKPDIICMQEVTEEYYKSSLVPDMEECGYKGVSHRSIIDECLPIFYEADKFTVVADKQVRVDDAVQRLVKLNQRAIGGQRKRDKLVGRVARPRAVLHMIKLAIARDDSRSLVVANVHLAWTTYKDKHLEDLRALQVAAIVDDVLRFADGLPYILAGDFSATPSSPTYRLLEQGKLDAEATAALKSLPDTLPDVAPLRLIEQIPDVFQHKATLCSAYSTVIAEPDVTCYDVWAVEGQPTCVDYIWYDRNSLYAHAILQTPEKALVTCERALPNEIFPSDHISLMAEFSLIEGSTCNSSSLVASS